MELLLKIRCALYTALLSSVFLAPVVSADDTEIFFGQSKDTFNTNPNILFILDTSGSMRNSDGVGVSRMDRMKSAMNVLLRESSSFNVGLMGFSGKGYGGSIRYPIGDLESDSGELCGGGVCPEETVIVQPTSSADDAIQNDDTLAVTLSTQELSLPKLNSESNTEVAQQPQVVEKTLVTTIASEIENDNGTTDAASVTSSSKWFYSEDHTNLVRYGYRFEDVKIPKDATVTSAWLSFTPTPGNGQTGDVSALIRLEVSSNPPELPTGNTTSDALIPTLADRLNAGRSTDSIAWNNVATSAPAGSNTLSTPDLSEQLQQIVRLPNWQNGDTMSFVIEPVDEYIPSANDLRTFYGTDETEDTRPTLHYTYSEAVDETVAPPIVIDSSLHVDEIKDGDTGQIYRNLTNSSTRLFFTEPPFNPRTLGFRFASLQIPNDAEILSATLSLTGAATNSEQDHEDWRRNFLFSGSPNTDSPSPVTPTPEETQLNINISAEPTGTPELYTSDSLDSRTLTSTSVDWKGFTISPGETKTSPDLTEIIRQVINTDSWSSDDDVSLILSAWDTYENALDNSTLVSTASARAPNKPRLEITYRLNATGGSGNSLLKNTQTTALRFQNVTVPPGATISSARLVFEASTASIDDVTLEISGEDTGNSLPITTSVNNIGARTRTSHRQSWNVEPWNIPDVEYSSPDIKNIIQSVTNNDDWCSGNPLTIFLKQFSGNGNRYATSFDQNPVKAPRLEITYAPETVQSGAYCSNVTFSANTTDSQDDAAEDMNTKIVDTISASLDTRADSGDRQTLGLRFRNIPVPKDAAILSATLQLTHENDITDSQQYIVKAESTASSGPFNNARGKIVDGDFRPTYATSVSVFITPGPPNDSLFSIDVTPLITEKTTDDNWVAGEAVVLIVEPQSDTLDHSFYAFGANEIHAPKLSITYQSERSEAGTRFQENLIETVNELVAQGGTPIVSSYLEGINYFLGEPVDYGLKRGRQASRDRFHRVSHPASYANGEVDRRSNCTDENLNDRDCRFENILPANGAPTYISPIVSECQQNHIVLLSDGRATSNTAAAKAKDLMGISACAIGGNDACGLELADWINDTDLVPTLNGKQSITTHTIGFRLNTPQLLQDMATNGGGEYYPAESSAELISAFQNIFINVSKTETTFVAPSATVSQANRLKNRDDIYFSLFKPEGTARWSGNVKRYKLGGNEGDLADILDVNNELAVDEDTGRFFDAAQSYWSEVEDGDSVGLGGAAGEIQIDGVSHEERNVYTFTGTDKDLTNSLYNELLPGNSSIQVAWLNLSGTRPSDTDYIADLLNWAHGRDEFDADIDGDTEEARAEMGDPLHSQPLIVNYANDRSVIHVATNEGFLHAIEHDTGEENFAFIPKELLRNLHLNYENAPTINRPYGLDGGMTTWIQDNNNNGVVDPDTDKAYLYLGMRRGGNMYYALDITDPDKPRYMWSIQGGQHLEGDDQGDATADGDFTNLGDTWSKPVKSKIWYDGQEVDVLMFGGGYDEEQDPKDIDDTDLAGNDTRQRRSSDGVGNGFYMVNATTGDLLYTTSTSEYSDLLYSVPTELRVIDINFDGLADQIYFGDMGGQVWRFDYDNNRTSTETIENRMNGGLIAEFAGDTPETSRRFYYPPDISVLNIEGQQQLGISIGSGWRAHPLDDVVEDRFYNFRMTQVFGTPVTEDGVVRYPVVSEDTTGITELTDNDVARTASAIDRGWFLPLRTGEKILSSSITLDGNIIFTSYLPSADTGNCEAAVGSGNIYLLDAATGNPVADLDDSNLDEGNTDAPLDAYDRRRRLSSSGIPSEASVLFPETGKATVFVGRNKIDEVLIGNLKRKTFWQEYIEENL